ncbi:MAG: hypothetical protein JXR19_11665, partial [Bacteroidia bacterium]
MNYRTTILYCILALMSIHVQAKNDSWHLYTIEDFNFYYQNQNTEDIDLIRAPFKQQLFALQNQLNYHLTNKIDIFLVEAESTAEQLISNPFEHKGSRAGLVEAYQFKLIINLNYSPERILREFRRQCGMLIFQEMMYGVGFQDQIRNANLLYLPDWLVEGLEFYLADQWSSSTDNRWRMVYEQYGYTHFNLLPDKYDAIKGASFIKFIMDNYGANALPTVLYMSRLTRKFHTALYYSFQRSPVEVYREWKLYYTDAYLQDQRKRIPVGGDIYAEDQLLDMLVVGIDEYYVLLNRLNKTQLWHKKGEKNQLVYTLSDHEKPLGSFSGAIQKMGQEVYLAVQDDKSYMIKTVGTKTPTVYQLSFFPTKIKHLDNELYAMNSNFKQSKVYKIGPAPNSKLRVSSSLEASFDGYVSDFTIDLDGRWIVLKSDWEGINELMLYSVDTLSLFKSVYGINHLIGNEDGSLFFNFNRNGVYNGVRFDIEDRSFQYLTDYRSDIAFHQSSDSFFAEYVLRLDHSALLITESVDLKDLYIYDSISPTYFSIPRELEINERVDSEYDPVQDSIPDYVLQSPVPLHRDFTLSNYDSLKKLEEDRRRANASISLAPDQHKPTRFYIQLFNEHSDEVDLPFATSIENYMPNVIGLRFGGSVGNQFNTKNLTVNYVGFRFWQNRDASISYALNSKIPMSINFRHRQRLSIVDELDVDKDRTNAIRFKWQLFNYKNLKVEHVLGFRQDAQIHLGTNRETLRQDNDEKARVSTSILINLSRLNASKQWNRSWQWKMLYQTQPYIMTNGSDWGLNLITEMRATKSVGRAWRFNSRFAAGTSLGNRPTFFILGGQRTDILNNTEERSFSSYKDAAYYQTVFSIRGFNSNYRNGNTYGVINAQMEWKTFAHFYKRPMFSELLDNFKLVFFGDIGTSLYGKSIYDKANALNTEVFDTPGSSFTVEVRNIRNPLIGSVGVGMRSV